MDELKPCPFCGSEAEYVNLSEKICNDHRVFCTECEADIKMYSRKCDAIKAWNTRTPRKQMTADELRNQILDWWDETDWGFADSLATAILQVADVYRKDPSKESEK